MKHADRMGAIQPFHVMALLARARELEAAGRSIVHMEIGEPDFVTPQPIIDAGIRALSAGYTHYTPATGLPALCERIAQFYFDRLLPTRLALQAGIAASSDSLMAVDFSAE